MPKRCQHDFRVSGIQAFFQSISAVVEAVKHADGQMACTACISPFSIVGWTAGILKAKRPVQMDGPFLCGVRGCLLLDHEALGDHGVVHGDVHHVHT